MELRNIAIIAHVDHGKTTLVDEMLAQTGAFDQNRADAGLPGCDSQTRTMRSSGTLVMDSGDLERERGITILAKNTAIRYNDVKINIIDTPGHADFGGEVERILKMVSGVLLLVDAAEGPMPQTRFVLQRALELELKIILLVNKVDRPDARVYEVVDEILELLIDLGANDDILDSPILFCSGRNGTASMTPESVSGTAGSNDKGSRSLPGGGLTVLFDAILEHIPEPGCPAEGPAKILVSSIDYNDYVGRIGIGRVERGTVSAGQELLVSNSAKPDEPPYKGKLVNLYEFEDLRRVPAASAEAGAIVAFSGIENITIGDTVSDPADPSPIEFVRISEPTVEMTFSVNDSPFAGREGKYVTSRNLRDRLQRELLRDVSLRVSDSDTTDAFNVSGRGEMHLSVLIETMRREGYEFAVSPPRVLYREIEGVRCEPVERVVCDVPDECVGAVIEALGRRKGEMTHMVPVGSRKRLEFLVPSRGLFGYRSEFLTDTRGEGIMSGVLDGYRPFSGEISRRRHGSLIAFESGDAVAYGLYNAQERGVLFIGAGVPVYAGQIVGQNAKEGDINVNVCKRKQLTNMRASGSDDALRLVTPRVMSLEQCLEYIADDELLEVTPQSLRLRKRELDHGLRMRAESKKKV